ncbi:MAG TPA: beta-ketoacyl-ACP synthase III [Candidatus Eisenbacteria bacterium]|nr:beta-ketoacyl-ACP synthase III [Candidatus Eisenbacteria bacterium]
MSPPPDRVRDVSIAGTGMYVPERVLTNADLEKLVDTSDEWIVERTGIRERRIAAPNQSSSDLALIACRRALEMARVAAEDVDQILLATTTPDRILPSCACTLQHKLGAVRAAAYDVFAACTGFVYGLGLGRGLIGAGLAERVLVVGVETLSRIVDYSDRNTCVLFGDGAGAALLTPCEAGQGLHAVDMHSDGELGEVLEVPAGISRNPASEATVRAGDHFIRMQGRKLFPFAVRSMEDSVRRCLGTARLTTADVDLFVPHQANLRIIDAVRERLGLPAERTYVNIDRYGNTSSASIPIALDEVVRAGRLRPGQRVAFAAFGGGATWGASVMTWTLAAQRPAPARAPAAVNEAVP